MEYLQDAGEFLLEGANFRWGKRPITFDSLSTCKEDQSEVVKYSNPDLPHSAIEGARTLVSISCASVSLCAH
jgi:hypothetical protein